MPSFTKLDPDNLDGHWLEQTELVALYSLKLANARLDLENYQIDFDSMKETVGNNIRKFPTKYRLQSKPTESAISNQLKSEKFFSEGLKKIAQLRHRVEKLSGYLTALEHRKRALTMLVDLHGQNYFSNPTASNENLSKAAKNLSNKRKMGKEKDEE